MDDDLATANDAHPHIKRIVKKVGRNMTKVSNSFKLSLPHASDQSLYVKPRFRSYGICLPRRTGLPRNAENVLFLMQKRFFTHLVLHE